MSPEGFSQQAEADSLPFSEIVFKVSIGCNMQPQHELDRDPLALINPGCDHCYMYTNSTAWQHEPEFMEPPVLEQAIYRVAEHADRHNLPHLRLIGHGGEPLLVLRKHPDYFTNFAGAVRHHIEPTGTQTHLSLQTNGLLLNDRQGPRIIDQLGNAGFRVGLSIDGPKLANDLHRRDRSGRSTHSRAERAARHLRESGIRWDILGVIDPRTNPDEVLEYLAGLQPDSINLFPMHANHSAPPLQHPGALSIGEWQKRAFDHYTNWSMYHPGINEPPFTMPFYDNYLRLAFGARSINDASGERTTQELFITSGGKYERLDTLKSADDGAVKTWRNIYEHSMDEMRQDPGIIARRMGFAALAPECQGCEVLDLCFGNHYPNRYQAPEKELSPFSSPEEFADAFRNPSIHCEDHRFFLGYVNRLVDRVKEPVPAAAINVPDHPGQLVQEQAGALFYENVAAEHRSRYAAAQAIPQVAALFEHSTGLQSFPTSPKTTEYQVSVEDINPLFEAIQSRKLVGRQALLAAGAIGASLHDGPVAYCTIEEDRMLAPNEVPMLSEDYNDAIVNSLVMSTQPYLRDLDHWGRQKAGQYWFITRAIATSILAHEDAVQGFVIPAQLPNRDYPSFLAGLESGVNFMADVSHRMITRPVPVSAADLPGDILIVDAPSGKPADEVRVLHEAAASLSSYKNPEQLANVFTQSGRGTITPLWGMWPSKTHGAEWQSLPSAPVVQQRLVIGADVTGVLHNQLQDNSPRMFDFYEPLHQNVLTSAWLA